MIRVRRLSISVQKCQLTDLLPLIAVTALNITEEAQDFFCIECYIPIARVLILLNPEKHYSIIA